MTLSKYEYYRTENGVLYCGDCLEIMPHLEPVDLVLTDPPYIVGAKECGLAGDRKYLHDITDAEIDKGFDSKILNGFKNWFCFCAKDQLVEIIQKATIRNWMIITWNKTNPTPLTNNNYLPDTEYIIHSYEKGRLFGKYKDKSRFAFTPVEKNNLEHPTVKPVSLISRFVVLGSIERETILDPFIGSGTTAVACERLNRRWIGIEIEEKYCAIAKQRIENERKQRKLF
uniref:Putative methyltransferase n=3 Tax=viral metagenome TaxID=1070528 RepID=A0A6M3X9N3_9ZZZZ